MTEVTIICNGCGAKSKPKQNAGNHGLMHMRGELRQLGWDTITNQSKDFCPACRAARAMKKDAKNRTNN